MGANTFSMGAKTFSGVMGARTFGGVMGARTFIGMSLMISNVVLKLLRSFKSLSITAISAAVFAVRNVAPFVASSFVRAAKVSLVPPALISIIAIGIASGKISPLIWSISVSDSITASASHGESASNYESVSNGESALAAALPIPPTINAAANVTGASFLLVVMLNLLFCPRSLLPASRKPL